MLQSSENRTFMGGGYRIKEKTRSSYQHGKDGDRMGTIIMRKREGSPVINHEPVTPPHRNAAHPTGF